MNKPPLATNMHLCCRDANHKHLYLLVNARTKTRVVEGGEKKKKKGERMRGKQEEEEEEKRGILFINLGNERVVVFVVLNCVKAICSKHFLE